MQSLNYLLPQGLNLSVELTGAPITASVNRSILTQQEKKKYESFGSSKRQHEYLAVRRLIRETCEQLGLNAANFIVRKDANGKPTADYNGRLYYISIAHSDQNVICAISAAHPVGIDIELAGRQINPDLRNRITSKIEKELLKGVSTLRIWTIKEALVKLQGKRLGVYLKECTITGRKSGIYMARINNDLKAQVFSIKHQNLWIAVAF